MQQMDQTIGSASQNKTDSEQLAELRRQVEALMHERVAPVAGDVAARAGQAATQVRDYTKEKAEAFAETVSQRPLTAVAVAAAIGYLFGRMR